MFIGGGRLLKWTENHLTDWSSVDLSFDWSYWYITPTTSRSTQQDGTESQLNLSLEHTLTGSVRPLKNVTLGNNQTQIDGNSTEQTYLQMDDVGSFDEQVRKLL